MVTKQARKGLRWYSNASNESSLASIVPHFNGNARCQFSAASAIQEVGRALPWECSRQGSTALTAPILVSPTAPAGERCS